MKLMEREIRNINISGVIWIKSKICQLAYGLTYLSITCIISSKLTVDDLIKVIQDLKHVVQSVQVAVVIPYSDSFKSEQ